MRGIYVTATAIKSVFQKSKGYLKPFFLQFLVNKYNFIHFWKSVLKPVQSNTLKKWVTLKMICNEIIPHPLWKKCVYLEALRQEGCYFRLCAGKKRGHSTERLKGWTVWYLHFQWLSSGKVDGLQLWQWTNQTMYIWLIWCVRGHLTWKREVMNFIMRPTKEHINLQSLEYLLWKCLPYRKVLFLLSFRFCLKSQIW